MFICLCFLYVIRNLIGGYQAGVYQMDLATSPPRKAARDTMVDPGISQSPVASTPGEEEA